MRVLNYLSLPNPQAGGLVVFTIPPRIGCVTQIVCFRADIDPGAAIRTVKLRFETQHENGVSKIDIHGPLQPVNAIMQIQWAIGFSSTLGAILDENVNMELPSHWWAERDLKVTLDPNNGTISLASVWWDYIPITG